MPPISRTESWWQYAIEADAEVENGALLAALVRHSTGESGTTLAARLVGVARDHLLEPRERQRFVRVTRDLLEAEPAQTGDDTLEEMERWRSLSAEIREHGGDDMPLSGFLHELDLRPIVEEPKTEEVRCLIIHQAKGKEFHHVYLIGVVEDVLPSCHAERNGENGLLIEEERRNCFVAITNTGETLTLTYARSYYAVRPGNRRGSCPTCGFSR